MTWTVKPIEAFAAEADGGRDLTPPAMRDIVRMRHEQRSGQGELAADSGETMLFTLGGEAELTIDGDTVRVVRDDFLYLEPDVAFQWRTLSEEPWTFIRVRTA